MMSFMNLPNPSANPSISDFHIICRACLGKESEYVKLQPFRTYIDKFNPEKIQNLCEKINSCSDIKIDDNIDDCLPSKICEKCFDLLLIANYFKMLTARSDEILKRILAMSEGKIPIDTYITPPEVKVEYDNDNDDNIDADVLSSCELDSSYDTNDTFNIDIKTYICDVCRKCFKNKSSLKCHMKVHNNGVMNENNLRKNRESKREIKRYIKISDDKKHEEQDNKDEVSAYYECVPCKLSFSLKDEFSRHMVSHDSSYTYKCYGCEAVFDKYSARTQHERYSCPNMPPGTKYECSKCKEQCPNRFRYDTHAKFGCLYKMSKPETQTIELEPLVKCDHCELTFKKKTTLKSHILNCHTEDKPYICEICGKGYAMVGSLNGHRKQSHTMEKNYKCTYCPYAARQQSSLNVHMRRHTLKYTYSCEICGACFIQNTAFHIHMRRHHREKEFQCEICKKMFSLKAAMKNHISSVHLGIKPYECKVCGTAFSRKKSLTAHLERAHNITVENSAVYGKAVVIVRTEGDKPIAPA